MGTGGEILDSEVRSSGSVEVVSGGIVGELLLISDLNDLISVSGESGAGESGAGESETRESGAGESETRESGAGESETRESGAGESGAGESVAGESVAGESGAGESGAGESVAGESGDEFGSGIGEYVVDNELFKSLEPPAL